MKFVIFPALTMLFLAPLTSCPARAETPETLESLQAREKQVRSAVEKVMGSVVAITSADKDKPGSGSGVIVGKDGLILTAAHVTAATGADLIIIFPDGRRVKGKAIGANKTTDAAMAKIEEPGEWPALEMGSSDTLRLGDWCIAMGHPGGFSYERRPPVRLGRIWRRDTDGAIFSNCPLIGGDSGGPLFDLTGRVIGINSSIHGGTEANRHVAIDTLRADWEKMLSGKTWGSQKFGIDPRRIPMTGATFDRESQEGVKVENVSENTPAAKSGLQPGDIIIRCDEQEVKTFYAFQRLLLARRPGDKIKLAVQRSQEKAEVELELARRRSMEEDDTPSGNDSPAPAAPEVPAGPRLYFGSTLEDAQGKVKVAAVSENSPAAKAGLIPGDILVQLNDQKVDTPAAAADVIRSLKPGDKLTLKALRNGAEVSGETQLEEKK